MKSTLNSDAILQRLEKAIQAKGWKLRGYRCVEIGDGIQAPGVRNVWIHNPIRVKGKDIVYGFFNAQDKGFHYGHYDISEKTAKELIA